jgi:hypothetical protein
MEESFWNRTQTNCDTIAGSKGSVNDVFSLRKGVPGTGRVNLEMGKEAEKTTLFFPWHRWYVQHGTGHRAESKEQNPEREELGQGVREAAPQSDALCRVH